MRKLRRWSLRGLLILITIVVMGLLVYGLPRLTGDRFAAALIRLDLGETQTYLCPDTSLGQVAALFGGENTLGSALMEQIQRGIQIPGWADAVSHLRLESTYNPLTELYTATYALQDTLIVAGFEIQGGVRTPTITLGVRRLNLISVCLTAL